MTHRELPVMDLPVRQPESPPVRGTEPRFLFATGARPLEGYTIKRGVGRGGFGEVYFALSDAGKEVALKLIRRNLDVELRGVTHCLNLKHPNLVALYDVRQDDQDNSWVIMEFVAGEALDEAIRRHPDGMPVDEALDWLRGIAAGVSYLHNHGIVHRDLKPGNVFRDEGIVKLGDYGLSKFISASRRSGQTESIGTVHYMAPEIANGRYGKEIDIYALGIMLYEMLTGRVPFEGESVGEVLMKHLTAEPDVAVLAEPYRTVVARALAKDPAVRFNSVAELLAALPPSAAGAGKYHGAGALTSAGTTAAVHAADEEPVWRFVRDRFGQGVAFWKRDLNTATKVLLSVLGVFALLGGAAVWIRLIVLGMLAYGAYRLIRWGVRRSGAARVPLDEPPRREPAVALYHAAAAQRTGPTAEFAERTAAGQLRRGAVPAAPPVGKTVRERVADLAGSLLFSAAASLALSVVMVLLRGQPAQPEQFAWLSLTSTLGAWAILVLAKFWEGVPGEQAVRRFVLLVIGLGLGAAAYGLDQVLLVDLPFEMHAERLNRHVPASFFSPLGAPLIPAFLVYFGFLFLLLRWWLQADPLRSTRLSLWATACTVFVAWALNLFWPFPQPWGLMVAAIMSIAVQLASPWVPDSERPRDVY
jgi:hypothetical protein